ncbi:hypothetical protein MFRU_016g01000 [Monilinia fructicola]|nr:hypothetical protein MFRU_016g01000 [Monilinia fructicola]
MTGNHTAPPPTATWPAPFMTDGRSAARHFARSDPLVGYDIILQPGKSPAIEAAPKKENFLLSHIFGPGC